MFGIFVQYLGAGRHGSSAGFSGRCLACMFFYDCTTMKSTRFTKA